MSYQTGIPTGQSTMSGGRAAATSGQGMSRPAYGIRQGMQRQQPVQRGNAPIQRSVQQPILQTQAAELCTFTVHRVHQEEVCQFLTQRGIGYHIHYCNIVFVVIYKVTENQRLDQLFTVKFS